MSRHFGPRAAVDRVSLDLYPGKITALVGESGSGKTTLARLFALFSPATAGEIRLDGKPVRPRGSNREYYGQVQMIFQDPFILGRTLAIHGQASGGFR